MVNRVPSGARYGIKDWLIQRLSAVVMIVYTLFVAGYLLLHPVGQYAGWQAMFHSLPVRLFTLLFVWSLLLHAWVGMRDIFMDYVHPTLLRLGLHTLVILALAAYGAWAVQILWGAA